MIHFNFTEEGASMKWKVALVVMGFSLPATAKFFDYGKQNAKVLGYSQQCVHVGSQTSRQTFCKIATTKGAYCKARAKHSDAWHRFPCNIIFWNKKLLKSDGKRIK